MSKLDENGCVPAKTECPFRGECDIVASFDCSANRAATLSCEIARSFDWLEKIPKKPTLRIIDGGKQ